MYYGVTKPFRIETIIKKSRFITTLMPITDAQDAETQLSAIRAEFKDATHNCYAYIGDNNSGVMRYSDDGEPQGTAGAPMLEVLKRRKLGFTLAVVTRYFGGVKLGANGLVGAYTDSVVNALDNAEIAEFKLSAIASVSVVYALDKKIGALIDSIGKVIDKDYGTDIKYTFAVPIETLEEVKAYISDMTLGNSEVNVIEQKYIAY